MTATLEAVQAMSDAEWAEVARLLLACFPTGRPEQMPESDEGWLIYAYVAGRGAGKTRTGAEWIVDQAKQNPGSRWAIVAPTSSGVRDTCIEGESGVLNVLRRRMPGVDWGRAWNRTLLEITLPNGSRIKGFSAAEPERLRGPQHHGAWCDELGSWVYPDAWDQMQFGLRLGDRPRTVVTTTPRPTKLIRSLRERADAEGIVRWVPGSTFDNAANLSAVALAELKSRYEGTRIGRQELYAELLVDTPGALWTVDNIEAHRVEHAPAMKRVVVAIDPAVTSGEDSDSTGIVAAGLGVDGELYVLHDRTCRLSPDGWAQAAVALYDEVEGDRIVAEVNNGGDLVETVLRTVDSSVPVRKVHASRGKRLRAEPVAALYEQGRVHHVGGLSELEDQMTTWTPDSTDSPDRLDALVWAITDLVLEPAKRGPRIVGGGLA
jgi:predicted phage terminase large subunit-like protein